MIQSTDRFYTGIGSRKTPPAMINVLTQFGAQLAKRGFVLRSGGAAGADSAFEKGARISQGKHEIFLPWKEFNNNASELYYIPAKAYELAREIHPAGKSLKGGPLHLHARNMLQVLGRNAGEESLFSDNYPKSEFLICWTEDGAQRESECTFETGGTASAIRLASKLNVPVFNLGRKGRLEELRVFLAQI